MPERLIVRGATVVAPGGAVPADILCEGGAILAVAPGIDAPGGAVLDASGLTAGPGFIDVHCHGGGGHSFFDASADPIAAYARWAPRHGLTSFLISTSAATQEDLEALLSAQLPAVGGPGAEPLGFHLEGPCLNPTRRGAFPPAMLATPTALDAARLAGAAGGRLAQVTLAPELPGALDLARDLRRAGCLPAMGHTDATAEEARAGFAAGIGHVTHLFNAMRPMHQREAGPAIAALLDSNVTCELICDGLHVAPEMLRLAYAMLGPQRFVAITDNLHLAGTATAAASFPGDGITVRDGVAARPDGTIVGSIEPIDSHFRNVMRFLGVDAEVAFRLCSTNPARVAGVASRKGAVMPGMDADLVLLDAAFEVVATVCRGVVAFDRRAVTAS
jgi:N-acetylglucosamine-6-phosphate deacetylase